MYDVLGPKCHPQIHGNLISEPSTARPASLAASAGRWAWPAGGPRWQPMGQLAAIPSCSSWQWVRAEVERKEAGQTQCRPQNCSRSRSAHFPQSWGLHCDALLPTLWVCSCLRHQGIWAPVHLLFGWGIVACQLGAGDVVLVR